MTLAPPTKTRFDLGGADAFQRELPGIGQALDPAAMAAHLQAALIGPAHGTTVRRCDPAQAILLDDCLVMRYWLELEESSQRNVHALVTGRLYPEPGQAREYVETRLTPLAERVRGHDEVAPFSTPIACIEALGMAVHAYPVDGDLPTLMEATDPVVAVPALATMLASNGRPVEIEGCTIEPVHYGRRRRCMLRYHLDLSGGRRLLLYGKVGRDGEGARTPAVVEALRAALPDAPFDLPECLGFRDDLQLVVLTSIAGVPKVTQLLKARLAGESPGESSPTLEEAVDACGRIAATLHTSGIRVGPSRTLEGELSDLRDGLGTIGRFSPSVSERLARALDVAASRGAGTPALEPCLNHGDYSYTQLIFDGTRSGLVDFDNVCQAEPALDLGHFLAYLRFAGIRARGLASPERVELNDALARRFTAAYMDAGGSDQTLERVPVYEAVSLARLAEHAWQRLKAKRLDNVLRALDERMGSLA